MGWIQAKTAELQPPQPTMTACLEVVMEVVRETELDLCLVFILTFFTGGSYVLHRIGTGYEADKAPDSDRVREGADYTVGVWPQGSGSLTFLTQ